MAISAQEAARRLEEAGISRSDRYQIGTTGKGGVWESSKSRAKINFAPAMQEVLAKKSYDLGLDKASGSDYDRGVRDRGVPNWQTGMQTAGEPYLKHIAPFVALWSQSLPTAGGARRRAANMKRMTENVQRFIDAKK